MRNQSVSSAILVLLLGCSPVASPVADSTPSACPQGAAQPVVLEEPAPRVAAPQPARVDDGLPGFDVVRLGGPLPDLPYRDFESFSDGLVNRHCTGYFPGFEGFSLSDVDIFEGCCGGGVFRLHAYVDTAASGSQAALMARLAERFGPGEVYRPSNGSEGRRVILPTFELRIIPFPKEHFVKVMFTASGDRGEFDGL